VLELGSISGLVGSLLGAAETGEASVSRGAVFSWLAPGLALLASALCVVFAALRVRSKLPAWTTVVCLGLGFVTIVAAWMQIGDGVKIAHLAEWISISWGDGPGQQFVANWSLYLDSLTILWMLFVTGLGALIALYASEYMEHDKGTGYCRFFFAFALFVFSMSCLVMADNLILLYLGWEGVGLCSYLLIGYFYKKPSAVAAAKKAFIVNRIGDLGLALGIMLIFVQFGTVRYAELFPMVEHYVELARNGLWEQIPFNVQLIPVLLMIGAFGKSAQLPLYVWLPDAMEGPTPVSALIHAATMVTAGVFLIARTYPLFVCSQWALPLVAWVGTVTALLAATIGMAQFDIKRIMAYSTVSQLGYMFAGLGVLTSVGAAFHVFTHAFFKATLFLCCGAVMHGFAGQLDLRKVSGLWSMAGWRIVAIAMLVGCLNLSGFPFTAGYFSKDMILAEAFVTPGFGLLGWVLLLTAGLTAYYTFRVFFRVFVGPVEYEPGDEDHGAGHDEDEDEHDEHAAATDTGAHDEGHGHGHGGFHPHAPKWAINAVLAVLAVSSVLVMFLYWAGEHHGWVGDMVHHSSAHFEPLYGHGAFAHEVGGTVAEEQHTGGTFLGMDPHKVMYYVSAVFGFVGIAVAAYLHGPRGPWGLGLGTRTSAGVSRADSLAITRTALADWARDKWRVDEFYDFAIRKPLVVFSHIFQMLDRVLVDGLVDLFGLLPRLVGRQVRPSQSGVLHGYALGMAGGIAILLIVVLVVIA